MFVSDDLVGKTLGKYELRERIGRGGMAEVYRAYHPSLDRYVAIKILHPFLGEDPEFKERFEREARSVAQLRHPSIVQVYDFDFDPDRELYYMVMEYVDGPTLRAELAAPGREEERYSTDEAIGIVRPVAEALSYAHSRGMIHRDVKPANIMLDRDGRVVLTDFGIARIISGPAMTTSGSMVGTPAYMSPEQGLGQAGDHRSDIYSLGVVLYQLVTGVLPFQAETPIAVVLKHVNEPLPRPSLVNPELPEEVERIIMTALAKAPEERYQSADDLIADLDQATASGGAAADVRRAAGRQPRARATSRRLGCFTWSVLGLVVLLSLAGGIYASFNGMLNPFVSTAEADPGGGAVGLAGELVGSDEEGTPPPTPDLEATRIVQTLDAVSSILSTTATAQPTPDLTATVLACDYDYELIEQTPTNGSMYPELTTLTLHLILQNDSECPLDDDTRLVFEEGYQLEGPDFVELDRELLPGEVVELSLDLRTPAYRGNNQTVSSTWLLLLPDNTQVGPPLRLELDIFPSVTATPAEEPPGNDG